MRVMVVEAPAARAEVCAILRNLGHRTIEADDNATAEAKLRRELPDVVIAGWGRPGLNGVELCRRVRTLERDHFTYFLLLTRREQHAPGAALVALESGVDDVLLLPVDAVELRGRLVVAARVTSLHAALAARSREQAELARELAGSARRDPLTGIWNRLRLAEDAPHLEARAARNQRGYCVAVVDIDDFKQFNELYGHEAGDHVLQRFAQVLRAEVRDADSLYRYGGTEFLAVFPDEAPGDALRAVGRILARLRGLALPHARPDGDGVVSASAGLAAAVAQRDGFRITLNHATRALHAAKREGRERVGIAAGDGEEPTVVAMGTVR